MAPYEQFALLLREQLRDRGWSVSRLADRLAIHRSTVSRWLNAETRPDTLDLAITIADLLLMTGKRRDLFLRAYSGELVEALPPGPKGGAPLLARQHYIPAPVGDFTGREDELSRLFAGIKQALRREAPAGVTIAGLGGSGKTELAYALARRLTPFFPDGQILLRMHGASRHALTPEAVLQTVLRIFDPMAQVPDELEKLREYYLRLLQRGRVLILADDAFDAEQVAPLLPPVGSALLVTSRQRFTLPGLLDAQLGSLADAEAEALLLTICSRIGAEAPQLAQHCGNLALALRVSATLLAHDPTYSVARYVQGLEDERARLFYLHDPENPTLPNVEASLRLSYAALEQSAQLALAQLSVFPGSFDLPAALAVLDLAHDEAALQAQFILDLLYERSLLEWDEVVERYNLHDLVRAFGAMRLECEPELRQRHARYYAEVARRANELYNQGSESLHSGLALFDRERVHIDAAWRWALAQQPALDAVDELVLSYADWTEYIGRMRYNVRREHIPRLEAALTVAERRGDQRLQALFLTYLGWAHNNLHDPERAIEHLDQAIAIVQSIGERRQEGIARGAMGYAYVVQGELERGIAQLEQSLPLVREFADRRNEGATLSYLGIAYGLYGQPQSAIDYFEQHLVITRELGDRQNESNVLCNLGFTYASHGESDRAIEMCQQALLIAQEIGDRRCEAIAGWNLGELFEQRGELARAIEMVQLCVDYEQEIGHPNAQEDAAYLQRLRERAAVGNP